jgi:hypothetical protein
MTNVLIIGKSKTQAKHELDSNGNGLRSHLDDDNFWPKLGGFLLRKLWHWVSLTNLRTLMCIMDLVGRFVIMSKFVSKGLPLCLNLSLCWVWFWRFVIMFEFVIVLSLILKVYHYVWVCHCVESNFEGLSLCLSLSLCWV